MGTQEDKTNGICVKSVNDQQCNSVTVSFFVKAGSINDGKKKGVAHFVEHMLFNGTKTRTLRKIREDIGFLSPYFTALTTPDQTLYKFTCLKEDVEKYFELASDLLQNPTFLPELIERERDIILQEKNIRESSLPEKSVVSLFIEEHYENHDVFNNMIGSYEDIISINQDDLINFHKKHYCADNLAIFTAGAIDINELNTLVEKYFSDMPRGKKTRTKKLKYIGPVIYEGEEKDIEAYFTAFLFKVPKEVNHYAKIVLATIMGDGLSSRLYKRLRERLGLVYSASADLVNVAKDAFFVIETTTSEELLEELIKEKCAILKCIKTFKVSDYELENAKKSLLLEMTLLFENADALVELSYDMHFYKGKNFNPQKVISYINSLTKEDILKTAQLIFNEPLSLFCDTKSKKMPSYQEICEAIYED